MRTPSGPLIDPAQVLPSHSNSPILAHKKNQECFRINIGEMFSNITVSRPTHYPHHSITFPVGHFYFVLRTLIAY